MLTLACAAAVLLSICAFSAVLFPLWRRTPRRALCLLVVLLGSSAGLYGMIGTPQAVPGTSAMPPRTLDEAIARLEQLVAKDPDRVEAWLLLSRAYYSEKQSAKALDACDAAVLHAPLQTETLIACAQLRLMMSDHDPQVFALLHRALALQPDHARARLLEGLAQRQSGQPALAAQTWQALRPQTPANARPELDRLIARAQEEAGLDQPTPTPRPDRQRSLQAKPAD